MKTRLIKDAKRGAWWGGAFGLWTGLWIVAWPAVNTAISLAWPEVPTPVVTLGSLSNRVDASIGIELPLLLVIPLISTLLAGGLGLFGSSLLSALGADRYHHVRGAMVWPIKPILKVAWLWAAWVGLFHLTASIIFKGDLAAALRPFGLTFLVWHLIVVFSVFHRPVAESDSASGWWVPSWPGMGPACAAVFLYTCSSCLGYLLGFLPAWAGITLWLPTAIVQAILTVAAAVALVDRIPLIPLWIHRGSWLRVRVFLSVAWLYLRGFLFLCWLVAPVISVYIIRWKTVPPISAHFTQAGMAPPFVVSLFSSSMSLVADYGVATLLILCVPYFSFALARLIVLEVPSHYRVTDRESGS